MLNLTQDSVTNYLIEQININDWKKIDCSYPPILDMDPILAANFLTVVDAEDSLVLLTDTFNNLKKQSQVNKALELNILYSKSSFDWFVKFTLEIDRLITGSAAINIPYEIAEELPDKPIVAFLPPLERTYRKRMEPLPYKVKNKNAINFWRIKYIKDGLESSDFFDGFPAWYIMSEITIYEEYSTKTNRRVRIDFINGEFIYYLAGASDKWRRIIGVPTEMDYVVASLIFKN